MPQFKVHSKKEQADSLAIKFPNGVLYEGKWIDGTIIRKWLTSLGLEFIRLESYLNYCDDEFSLIRTNDLIDRWEFEYGMNSNCFMNQTKEDLEQRIKNITTLISANGTTTKEQWESLALALGVPVTVDAGYIGYQAFPYTFPMSFYQDPRASRFTMYVNLNQECELSWSSTFENLFVGECIKSDVFPYTFPMSFEETQVEILKCFFDTLKPANTIIVYQ